LLEVSRTDLALLMGRLGKVMELPSLSLMAVQESFPGQSDTCRHWSTQVNTALASQNLLGNWDTFINQIDSHTISYLKLTTALLDTKTNTKAISDDDIAGVRKRFSELLTEILANQSLSAELKIYLARTIRQLMVSIDEYFLTGALPLLTSMDAALGHAIHDAEYKGFLKDTDLGAKLLEMLVAMSTVVSIATGLPLLTREIQLLLGN